MKCNYCGEEMTLTDMPQDIFTIPFTKGRFSIWDWKKKGWVCFNCAKESEDRREEDLYNSIVEDVGNRAYQEGLRDACRD